MRIVHGSADERKIIWISIFIFTFILILDQATKFLAIEHFSSSPPLKISSFFNLVLVRNTGAAWGIFAGRGGILLTISLTVFILLTVFHRLFTEGWPERYYALALLLSGISGNSIDRVFRDGAVVDFLDFFIGKYHWPAFNVADSAICVSVAIFIISNLIRPTKTEETKTEPGQAGQFSKQEQG